MQTITYSVIMPYLNRLEHLRRTLQSFLHHYGKRDDYEVVLIEDSKNKDGIRDLMTEFIGHGIAIRHTTTGRKDGPNPAPLFNAGVRTCAGRIVVITNPECLHMTNVLGVFDREFRANPDVYVVSACRHVRPKSSFTTPEAFQRENMMWYQHSEHRNLRYHWCSALAKAWYDRIGGFDERYADGIAYDDDDFRDRVEQSAMHVVVTDEALVFHQEHDKFRPHGWKELLDRNQKLYEAACDERRRSGESGG